MSKIKVSDYIIRFIQSKGVNDIFMLAGGGLGVARVGDMVVGVGNLGLPIVGAIASGSPKVTSG